MTRPSATVVVCTRHRPAELARCLARLAQLDPAADEVLVVDNSAGDRETERTAERFGARYVVEPRGGASVARNTGAMLARCELAAYTDDDAEPDSGWLGLHAEAFRDELVCASTGRILPLGSEGVPPATGHEGDLGKEAFRIDPASPDWFAETNFGRVGIGNLVIRRSLLELGWRFDEHIGVGTAIPGGEENRALSDVVRLGFAVVYVPDAIFRHGGRLDPAQARARRVRILKASVAYATMLAVEEPEARPLVVRELRRALRGGMGGGGSSAVPRRAARLDAARAVVVGPLLYARVAVGKLARRSARRPS